MSYIVKTKGRKFIVDADSHKDAVKKVRDSLLKDGYSYEDFEKDLEKMGIKGHTSTLFAEAKRGLPNLKRIKELSGGWWKDVDAERIYKLAMNVRDSELSTNKYEKEFGLVGRTQDKLIESGSEKALQKNIATEIKAGKDPKQAAAIAYSIQRENDGNIIPKNAKKIEFTFKKDGEKLILENMGYMGWSNINKNEIYPNSLINDYLKSGLATVKVIDSAINDAEIPHITKEQWNKIPKEYKTTDPKTGKKQAFAGSLGIAPGGTTLLTEGMHFIIDSEEKNYTYIMFGTTGEKRVDNLTKAEAEHLLKNNKLLGYDGKIVETKTLKDAKQEYRVNYHNSYTGRHAVDYVEANNVKEALRKFGRDVALRGDGTANINVHSISPNEGYQRIYGKLSELLKNKDFQDSVEDDITNQQYFTDKIEKAKNVGKFTLWKDEEGNYYLDATISRSGKRLQNLKTKDINEARRIAKEHLDFIEDSAIEDETKIINTKLWNPDFYLVKEPNFNEVKEGIRKVLKNSGLEATWIELSVFNSYVTFNPRDKRLDNAPLKKVLNDLLKYINKNLYVDKLVCSGGQFKFTIKGFEYLLNKYKVFKDTAEEIEDKSVFSEETMNSMQEGIEKDYESMENRLEKLHDTSAPKEIEDLPIKARQELRNAKEKGPKLLEILSQLQDIVNKASAEERAEVRYKAEKILADLKKQFGLERETYIKLDSAIEDERLSPMTYSKLKELGYDQDDWKDLTQEQANELVAKGRKETTNGETSNEENSTIETKSTNKNIEKYEVPEEYDASKWTETEEYTKFMKEQFKTGDPKVSEYGIEFKGNFSKEDLDKVRNYFDGEGLDILETKNGIMLSQGADYVDDQEEYEEFAKQREEWLNQENKPKIENNPENRGRWLELIKKQFDKGELSEEERKELEELDAVINPPKTEEQKERDKEKTKLNTELETLKSELKPNNRYYWKKSEIKEKEDRIAELERKIAELESK